MKIIWIIFQKEFRCLVLRPFFFIVMGLFTCIWSYSFFRSLAQFTIQSMNSNNPYAPVDPGQLNIHYMVFSNHISLVHILLLFALPAFTMRLFAEEKKQGTFALLTTYPIHSYQIAVGKYFGAFACLGLLVGVSLIYPLLCSFVVENMPWGMLFSSYLGLILICSVYAALGILASSLTKSIMLSVILGVMFNLFILLILGQSHTLTDIPFLKSVLHYISFAEQFVSMLRGGVKISSLFWLMSFVTFLIFITERVVEISRWR